MTGPPDDREREKLRLARIRASVEPMAGDEWGVRADAGGMVLVSRRSTGEDAELCTLGADALPCEQDLVLSALDDMRFLLGLLDRASAAIRQMRAPAEPAKPPDRAKSCAAQAAMLLPDRAFQRFLETHGVGGAVRDKTAADTRLKGLLSIHSKTELDTDPRAQAAWQRLRRDFYAWKRGEF